MGSQYTLVQKPILLEELTLTGNTVSFQNVEEESFLAPKQCRQLAMSEFYSQNGIKRSFRN